MLLKKRLYRKTYFTKPVFLEITNPQIETIINRLQVMNVKFTRIDYASANKELFNSIYANNMYILNFDMIVRILKNVYEVSEEPNYLSKSHTIILSKPDEPIVDYINANIDDYRSIVIEKCGPKINDDQQAAIYILNHVNKENQLLLVKK